MTDNAPRRVLSGASAIIGSMTESDQMFTAHPSGGQSTLIQYNQHMMSERLVAIGYADAARRQAIELQLKINVRDPATLRSRAGESDEWLKAKVVDERLRNPRKSRPQPEPCMLRGTHATIV